MKRDEKTISHKLVLLLEQAKLLENKQTKYMDQFVENALFQSNKQYRQNLVATLTLEEALEFIADRYKKECGSFIFAGNFWSFDADFKSKTLFEVVEKVLEFGIKNNLFYKN